MRGTYPRLVISCFTVLELYALSRHRCCFVILFFVVGIVDVGRLITVLHTTSVTAFTSLVLAEVIAAESGMPFLSV